MLDIIGLAQDWIEGGKATAMDAGLLRNLVEANMSNEDGKRHLSDDELLSNIFVCPFLPPLEKARNVERKFVFLGFPLGRPWYLCSVI